MQNQMFKVKIEGFNKVKAEFEAATSKLTNIVDSELEAASKEWVTLAKRDAPADNGSLIGAITSYSDGSLRYEIVAQKFYAPFMEFGTKGKYKAIPGTEQIAAQFKGYKGGGSGSILKMIAAWVKRKGITGTYSVDTKKRTGNKANQKEEDLSVAWRIVMSILINGVKPHPFFFKQQAIVWPKMLQRITRRIENSKLDAIKNKIEPV